MSDSDPQRFSRWFVEWPTTHVYAGRTVEVMPVSEHERLREAAQAALDNEFGWAPRLKAALLPSREDGCS